MTELSQRPQVQEQLAAIARLSRALDSRAIDYWVFGGWAVDFWVGAVTRPHDDIDVVAWRRDYDVIEEVLEAEGLRHVRSDEDVVGTRYEFGDSEVEFTFVETDADGAVIVPIPDHPVTWTMQPFGDTRRELSAVSTRVIPLDLLRSGKAIPREEGVPADKDRADYQALSRIAK